MVAYFGRGNAHKDKGDHDRAIKDYSEAIRLDPKYEAADFNRGVVYSLKGDCERGSPEVVEETVRSLDVATVSGDTVDLPAGLSETEHLFVTAWLAGHRTTKVRRGDGLAWAAPGFTPPDREGRG